MTRHGAFSRTSCVLFWCWAACAPEAVGGSRGARPLVGAAAPVGAAPVASAQTGAAGGPAGVLPAGAPNSGGYDGSADQPGLQFRVGAVGADAAATADLRGHWTRSAAVGAITGQVIAADTGAYPEGTVYTNAPCTGPACDPTAQWNSTPLTRGVFYFQAGNLDLTLSPNTQFYVEVSGYRPVVIAHGPKVEVEGRTSSHDPHTVSTIYLCPTDADDFDKDGICDAAERQYGTNPELKDSDADALSDTLELYGHAIGELEGEVYDIRALGASPLHADIFMAVRYTGLSNFKRQALTEVMQAFEAAPRANPDGTRGIHLNILYDDRAISDSKDDLAVHSPVWDHFDSLRVKYYGKRPYAFHHALFLSNLGALASGESRGLGASDLVVSMNGGNFEGTILEQAGTLMHELGHNLGLHHNGYSDESYIPHYMSLMSYNYQVRGVPRTTGPALDYSRVALAKIDEANVDERAPFAPLDATQAQAMALYSDPWIGVYTGGKQPQMWQLTGKLAGPFDLDGDEAYTLTAIDLNGNGTATDRFPETRNDWDSIVFGGGVSGAIGDVPDAHRMRMVAPPGPLGPCLPPSQLLANGPSRNARSAAQPDPSDVPPDPNLPQPPADPWGTDPMDPGGEDPSQDSDPRDPDEVDEDDDQDPSTETGDDAPQVPGEADDPSDDESDEQTDDEVPEEEDDFDW